MPGGVGGPPLQTAAGSNSRAARRNHMINVMMCPAHARDMKAPTTKSFLRVLLMLSLSTGPVGCFIVSGGGCRTRSTAQELRRHRCVDRPLQSNYAGSNAAAPVAVHPASRSAGVVDVGGQRRVSSWRRAGGGVDRACWRKVSLQVFVLNNRGMTL